MRICIIEFLIYTIILILKYLVFPNDESMLEVVKGFFLVNIFFFAMTLPLAKINESLKNSEFFLDNKIVRKICIIPLFIASITVLVLLPKLQFPLDIMSAGIIWGLFYLFVIYK